MAESRTIGPWTLIEELGRGGNAIVWRATRDGLDGDAALKVINATKADKEPYRRFVTEIEFLRSLGDTAGVLPLTDAYLPDAPSKDDRPWLAMPIATPIADALAGAELTTVVQAVLAIARTLDRLKQESGVAHRDVKPGNLYERNSEWLVGDFGLIAPPDKDELAKTGRPVGPAHYTAYELIIDPTGADPHPPDVYSLAKTLWVLATGQGFPPEGHQAASVAGFNVADWRPDARAGALDRLIDRCTRLPPDQRPIMIEVVSELETWLEITSEAQPLNLGDLHDQLRGALAADTAAYDREAELKSAWLAAVRMHSQLMKPLHEQLHEIYPRVEVDAMDDKLTNNMMKTLIETGARTVLHTWQRCTRVPTGPEYHPYTLRIGRGIEVADDGDLILHAFVDVGDPGTSHTDYHWTLNPPRSAPVGTVAAERALEQAVEEVRAKTREAFEIFVRQLTSGAGPEGA
jgi:serine/threonine protein kinase